MPKDTRRSRRKARRDFRAPKPPTGHKRGKPPRNTTPGFPTRPPKKKPPRNTNPGFPSDPPRRSPPRTTPGFPSDQPPRHVPGPKRPKNPGTSRRKKMAGGGSINQLIDKKYKSGGIIKHNPSTINP